MVKKCEYGWVKKKVVGSTPHKSQMSIPKPYNIAQMQHCPDATMLL
jgi:hypothetical protein